MTIVGHGPGSTQVEPPRRLLVQPLRATTTPGRLRLLLVSLVALSLIWGAVAAWTAFLSGGLEPLAARHRYLADIAEAASSLESATAVAGQSAAAADLARISADLPIYTGEVETARADNRLGLPLGAAYLREASGLMRGTLLPAAREVSAEANSQLSAASGRATGLPLALVLLAIAA